MNIADVIDGRILLTMSPSASWCRIMAAGETSCAASEMPVMQAGVLLREEALRDDHEQIDRERDASRRTRKAWRSDAAARGRVRAHSRRSSASKPRSLSA